MKNPSEEQKEYFQQRCYDYVQENFNGQIESVSSVLTSVMDKMLYVIAVAVKNDNKEINVLFAIDSLGILLLDTLDFESLIDEHRYKEMFYPDTNTVKQLHGYIMSYKEVGVRVLNAV